MNSSEPMVKRPSASICQTNRSGWHRIGVGSGDRAVPEIVATTASFSAGSAFSDISRSGRASIMAFGLAIFYRADPA
jgi:hypothetical protein